jgi:hypothetical protein
MWESLQMQPIDIDIVDVYWFHFLNNSMFTM